MKYLLLIMISIIVMSCATEPRVPFVCQDQWVACIDSYEKNEGWFCAWRFNEQCSMHNWSDECERHYRLCKMIHSNDK
jgi:hypothetical protein